MGLLKLIMNVVELPVAVVKDIVTLGGAITEEDSAVVKTAEDIKDSWDEIKNK